MTFASNVSLILFMVTLAVPVSATSPDIEVHLRRRLAHELLEYLFIFYWKQQGGTSYLRCKVISQSGMWLLCHLRTVGMFFGMVSIRVRRSWQSFIAVRTLPMFWLSPNFTLPFLTGFSSVRLRSLSVPGWWKPQRRGRLPRRRWRGRGH